MRPTLCLLALLLIPLLAAGAVAGEPKPAVDTKPLVTGNTAFAFDLYAKLREGPDNLFLSPHSISACLGMTRAGAAGNTAAQMDEVFHFPRQGLGQAFGALRSALVPPKAWSRQGEKPAYELAIANRLFGQSGYAFREPFLGQMRDDFGAALEQLDIARAPSSARARINGWVEEQTKEKIKNLLPEGMPTPDTRLVLVNAIYFKSQWQEAFRERATVDAPFHRQDGSTVKSRLMQRTGGYLYAETETAQLLEMPYLGGAMSMVVLLPKAKDGLPKLEAELSAEKVTAWMGELKHRRVAVAFPKYRFTSSFELAETLIAMGMPDAFSPMKADFSGMTEKEPLFIGIVVHKAFVAVDEKGTEAAAATAVGMRAGSAARPQEPTPVRADHPFLFVIRHRQTGAILFLGRVMDPTA